MEVNQYKLEEFPKVNKVITLKELAKEGNDLVILQFNTLSEDEILDYAEHINSALEELSIKSPKIIVTTSLANVYQLVEKVVDKETTHYKV